MKSIELSKEQMPFVSELESLIHSCETTMGMDIEDSHVSELLKQLKVCQTLMATQSRIIELSTLIFNEAKRVALNDYMELQESSLSSDKFYQKMSAAQFKTWFETKVNKWDALYNKSLRVIKSMDRYNENMRTLISAEKDLAKHTSGQV